MSIANGTTHYDYPQVQLTDRPTFADFNPAFEDIDAKLYSLISGASTDHSAIEALQTGLGETNLLLASVKNTADSASGKADTNAENITLLQTGLGNTDRAVATKLDSVAIAEPYDASAGTYSVGDIVVYNGQRYKCTTAVAVAEPFDADKWTGEDVETVLEHLQDEIDNIPSGGTAADVSLAPITGMTAANVQDGISELNDKITDFQNYTLIKDFTANTDAESFNASAYKFIYVCGGTSNQGFAASLTPIAMLKDGVISRLSAAYYTMDTNYNHGGVLAVTVSGDTITLTAQDFFKGSGVSTNHVYAYGVK